MIPAYVLHKRDFRESSAILELVLEGQGRCAAVVKGARSNRKTSKSALIQPFQPILISLTGHGNLKNVISLESAGQPHNFQNVTLYSGLYANELVTRLCPQHFASETLFPLYQSLLQSLAVTDQVEPLLRIFEINLLDVLGYAVDFTVTFDAGEPIQSDGLYQFLPQQGFCLSPQGYPGDMLLQIGRYDFSTPQVLKCAKALMRQALSPWLGNKPLKSRELFINQFKTD